MPRPGARIEREIRHRLADWRAMLRREVPKAREILRNLVVGRIVFTPPRGSRLRVLRAGSFGRLLAGTLQKMLSERKLAYWAEQVEIQGKVATAWTLRAERKHAEALAAMRAAADHEDKTEKHAITPGPIMPARELLGDLLVELGRPADALSEYERSVAKEPNSFRGLYGTGLAPERAGDQARAHGYFEKLVAICALSDSTRRELADAKQVLSRR